MLFQILKTFHKCISCRDGCILPISDNEAYEKCTECSMALRQNVHFIDYQIHGRWYHQALEP